MKFVAAVFLTTATLFLTFTASAQTITPGLWKAKTVIRLDSMALPAIDVDDCMSAVEAKDVRKYIQENLMPETQCTIKEWNYKNPKLNVRLSCENSQYTSQGELAGTVTEKAFHISGALKGTHMIMGAVNVGIDYKGTYSKPCK